MSGAATLRMSAAVDTDCGLTPLASAKCDWLMPSVRRRRVHLRHEGGDAAGVPAGQQVGVVVGRVHEQPAEHLLLGQTARRA